MPRGPNIDRDKTKNEIFKTCFNIIRKNGAGSVSARKIAAKIGCSVGTIYNIYKGIDTIILEVNASTIDYLEEQVVKIKKSDSDPLQALHNFGSLYVTFSQENYHLWYSLLEYPRKHAIKLPSWYQRKVDKIFSIISETISPLFQDDMEKADMATKVLWAGFHGISSLAVSGRLESVKAESAPILVESLINNYIAGMINRKTK